MVYAGLLQEVAHIAAESVELSRVKFGVFVFEDPANVNVFFVVGSGVVPREHVVDGGFRGQVLGQLCPDGAGDFSSVSGLAVILPTSRHEVVVDDMGP